MDIDVQTTRNTINVSTSQTPVQVSTPSSYNIQVIEEGRMSEILDAITQLQNAVTSLNSTKMSTTDALAKFVLNGKNEATAFQTTYAGTDLEGKYLKDYLVEESGDWENYFAKLQSEIEESDDGFLSVPYSDEEMVTFTTATFGEECYFVRWKTGKLGRVMFEGEDPFSYYEAARLPIDIEGLSASYTSLNSSKQNKTDSTLQTTAKTVAGAINEVYNSSLNSSVVSTVGYDSAFDGTRLAQAELAITALQNRASTDETNITQLGTEKQSKAGNTELETTDKTITGAINEVRTLAIGREKAVVYNTLAAMVTALNAASADVLKTGDNVYIVTKDVPDLWVLSIESSRVAYSFTTDEAFDNDLKTNGSVQVGYYKFAKLEIGKVDLDNVVDSDSTITGSGSGNVVTGMSIDSNGNVTLTKGITALTEHQDISGKQNASDTSLTTTAKTVVGAINEIDAAMMYYSVVTNS